MADYTPNKESINRVMPGRTYDNVDQLNYLDITRRLVHLEQILSGKTNEINVPSTPPIGSFMAWHKSFPNTPALSPNWVECNGQTLSDPESKYNGQVIPNLNGAASGADLSNGDNLGKTGDVFLRGDETSGATQLDNFQGHVHTASTDAQKIIGGVGGVNGTGFVAAAATVSIGAPVTDGINGTPRTSAVTRPRNMSVVWIMRTK